MDFTVAHPKMIKLNCITDQMRAMALPKCQNIHECIHFFVQLYFHKKKSHDLKSIDSFLKPSTCKSRGYEK